MKILTFFLVLLITPVVFMTFVEGDILLGTVFSVIIITIILVILYGGEIRNIFGPQIQDGQKNISYFLRKKGFMPNPTEASMFVMASTILLITLTSTDIWSEISYAISGEESGKAVLVLIYILMGIYFSIFHAFSQRKRTEFENQNLKWFSVVTLALASISTAVYIFNSKEFGYIIFTIWSTLQAILLMFFSGGKYAGEFVELPTRNAKLLEILLGLLVVITVISLNKLFFAKHWSLVFSSILLIWSLIGPYFESSELINNPPVQLTQ